MIVIRSGKGSRYEYLFICKHCGTEWLANKAEAHFSLSGVPHMNCPSCDVTCHSSCTLPTIFADN